MSFLTATGLDRFNPAQRGIGGMRVVATGLLVLMAALYAAARAMEPRHPAWGYLRAFAEAAMVGGMADWFAVTALFRHPLGLPIPHTAIIPRNKDRIGDSLAQFLRANFLTPAVVARRMRRLDVAGALGRFLSDPHGEGRLRAGAARMASDVLEALDQEKLGGMVKGAVAQRMLALDVAAPLGQALAQAIDENRHVPMLDAGVAWLVKTLEANEPLIREMVQKRAGWLLRLAGLDEKLADAILDGLRKLFGEMAEDPAHPVRQRFEQGLADIAERLQRDPALRARVAALKADVIANPAVKQWIDSMWENARTAMLRAARDPSGMLAGRFGETMRQLGETITGDPQLKATINGFARRAVAGAVAAYGDGIVRLVSDTVRGWRADTVTDRLEAAVGRDLQYIRVNGTLVGGLVGLVIHLVDQLAG
jgi:uncharacterized membrane-anchored protein YjiN (DUF445 family)